MARTTFEPAKHTECGRLLAALKKGKVTSYTAFIELQITSLHRRLSDLREMGYAINKRRVAKTDERGKEVEHWYEYWVA